MIFFQSGPDLVRIRISFSPDPIFFQSAHEEINILFPGFFIAEPLLTVQGFSKASA